MAKMSSPVASGIATGAQYIETTEHRLDIIAPPLKQDLAARWITRQFGVSAALAAVIAAEAFGPGLAA